MSAQPEFGKAPTTAAISYRIAYDRTEKGLPRLGPRLSKVLRSHNFVRRKSDIQNHYIWDNKSTMPSSVAEALCEFWHEASASTDEVKRIIPSFQLTLK